jgi:ABC-type phosphate transport system substrate-binding protein
VTRWKSDGLAIEPVDQVPASASRARFSETILHRNVAAMQAFWQQQIFSGRDVPPVEKSNDEAVIAFVREHPGAIGYVSPDSALDGVRTVSWK